MRVFDGIIMGGLMGHRYYPDTAVSPPPPEKNVIRGPEALQKYGV